MSTGTQDAAWAVVLHPAPDPADRTVAGDPARVERAPRTAPAAATCDGEGVRLLLVRHGQIPSNVHGILDTAEPGPSLNDIGREQARALVPTLADEPIEGL